MIARLTFGVALLGAVPAFAFQTAPDTPLGQPILKTAGEIEGIVETNRGARKVTMKVVHDTAYLVISDLSPRPRTQFLAIDRPDVALVLLSDQRYAFLWQALTEWAGPGLEKLRTVYIETARQRMEEKLPDSATNTAEASSGLKARAVLQYAQSLSETGKAAEAKAVILSARSELDLTNDNRAADWVMLTLRLAKIMSEAGYTADALQALSEIPEQLREKGYKLNLDVNKAALLAETGAYQKSLQLITDASVGFEQFNQNKGDGGAKVGGSARHFDWIRACALHGLGRRDEARKLIDKIADPSNQETDSYFVVSSNGSVRTRAYFCMHDVDRLTNEFTNALLTPPIGDLRSLLLQPSLRNAQNEATLAKVRADPRVLAAASKRMRILPAEMTPALNHWRTSGFAGKI